MEEKTHAVLDKDIFKITLTPFAKSTLQAASHWAFIIAVLGTVWVVLTIGSSLFAYVSLIKMDLMQAADASKAIMLQTGLNVLVALFCLIPNYFLYQFSDRAKKGLAIKDASLIGQAFDQLKNFFKYGMAVIVLSILSFVVVGLGT